ncbi:MAG: fumarate hydratase C-terminal domain-containing protein, partial [Spirochaetaceae bacterium]|nr:fumarate hydratase C-terminal domain-containing protein [Spirochaetaceae bacterium]
MNTPVALHTPLSSADLISLRAGDAVRLSGAVYTARDAAHIKIAAAAAKNAPLPFDFNGALLFYAGPAPARPGKVIGPIAPTTARRMDGWLELTCKLGAAGSIGKGGRSAEAAEICARYKRVYFLSYGGLAALT